MKAPAYVGVNVVGSAARACVVHRSAKMPHLCGIYNYFETIIDVRQRSSR